MGNREKLPDGVPRKSQTSPRYSDVLYRTYLKTVEESGIEDSIREPEKKRAIALKDVLANSRILARRHFIVCHKEIVKLMEQIGVIDKEIQSDLEQIISGESVYQEPWQILFENFNKALSEIFTYAQEKIIKSFDTKVKRMDQFTICLFGRTKAGKSTTMEALTHGDGESIGEGAQNTTLDTKEYPWQGLVVVDTPGIDAMEEQEKLETEALEFADNADLILFLLPHQIEERDFDTFERFYQKNKPIVILLNIKKGIGEKGTPKFKRFLDHPDDVYPEDEISGYKNRIHTYIFRKLGIQKDLIPILPIHSHAAFRSNNTKDPVIKEQLYRISHFEQLEDQLKKEVKDYGELYKIKNPYDTVILFSALVEKQFQMVHEQLDTLQKLFESNYDKFRQVELRIHPKLGIVRTKILRPFFDRQRDGIDRTVDELLEAGNDKRKREEIRQNFIPENQLHVKLGQCQEEIRDVAKKEIHDFFGSYSDELPQWWSNLDKILFKLDVRDHMEDMEGSKSKAKLFQRVSTFAPLMLIFVPPAWPIIVPAAIATALASLGFNWLSKKQKEKSLKKKQELRETLKQGADQYESKVNQSLDEWLKKLLDQIKTQHIGVMREFMANAKKHLDKVTELQQALKETTDRMKKAKYQAMLRHIMGEHTMTVTQVLETKCTIQLTVASNFNHERKGISDQKKIEAKLSRVEEKPIKLMRGNA